MLNGMAGGTIPSTIVLDKRHEYQEMENGETVVVVTYPTLYQIIRELIEQYGGEPINNIVISPLAIIAKDVKLDNVSISGDIKYSKLPNKEINLSVITDEELMVPPESQRQVAHQHTSAQVGQGSRHCTVEP